MRQGRSPNHNPNPELNKLSLLGAQLAKRSVESIEAAAPHLLSGGAVRISRGNALDPALLAEAGPFDAIHVGAAAAHPHMVRAMAH